MIPIPGAAWRYGAAFALGMVIAATAQGWRYGERIADIHAAQAEALATAQGQARAEEQRRQIAIEGIRQDAQDHIEKASADAVAADAAADSLREQVAKLARRPARCPGVADGSETADPTGLLLADVLSRIDARAGELAAYADRARIAGEACAFSYDAVRAAR